MKTVIIIQARMGSSRLPGKVLMPLFNKPVLQYVIDRCRKIKNTDEVIVATSTLPGDDAISTWCQIHGVACFRGSEEDVLSRYYECALEYKADTVVRVTADCPFVDYEMAEGIIDKILNSKADIVDVVGELPRGLVVEAITTKALAYIFQHGKESRHREHVTYFAYEYPEQFHRATYHAALSICEPYLRVTLDTPEDYACCEAISSFFGGATEVSSKDVVAYLKSHPEVSNLNAHIEQKPVV